MFIAEDEFEKNETRLVKIVYDFLPYQPPLSDWLSMEGLIPRFVAAVDNVAEGESPRPNLLALAPTAKFRTVERKEIKILREGDILAKVVK